MTSVETMLRASLTQLAHDRFKLHAWADGYKLFDRGELICVFHGPQSELAGKVLRMLREEAERA